MLGVEKVQKILFFAAKRDEDVVHIPLPVVNTETPQLMHWIIAGEN